ncbi:uncharacterized protein LOC103179131 isoform X1 [Callorhinchus milii]|nr:uncharacterized protein LOC103179131 isoform X1 [Callorhinchus milii]
MGLNPGFLLFFTWPLVDVMTVDDCQEHEYWAEGGNCVACKECGAGLELSQDCGFGTGGDGQCVRCGHNRYKETWGFGKCKRCLSCSLFNRLQKSNCTALSNSVCGDCLVGFYSKPRLGGLQDMACSRCAGNDPGQPQCNRGVDTGKQSPAASPARGTLVAVMCGSLVTVLLALLILGFIHCRRLLAEKLIGQPRGVESSSSSDGQTGDMCTDKLLKPGTEPLPGTIPVLTMAKRLGQMDVVYQANDNGPRSLQTCVTAFSCRHQGASSCEAQTVTGTLGRGIDTAPRSCGEGGGTGALAGVTMLAEEAPTSTHCASAWQQARHVPVECTELDVTDCWLGEGGTAGQQGAEGSHWLPRPPAGERTPCQRPPAYTCLTQPQPWCMECGNAQHRLAEDGHRQALSLASSPSPGSEVRPFPAGGPAGGGPGAGALGDEGRNRATETDLGLPGFVQVPEPPHRAACQHPPSPAQPSSGPPVRLHHD